MIMCLLSLCGLIANLAEAPDDMIWLSQVLLFDAAPFF